MIGYDIRNRYGHGNVFCLGGGESNLGLQLRCPSDRASGVVDDPSAARLCRARIVVGKIAIPISRKISIAITFKSLRLVGVETDTNITSLLEIACRTASP